MRALEGWLNSSGNRVAAELEERGDQICKMVSDQMSRSFQSVCDAPDRVDNETMQRMAFIESPKRVHRLTQTALRLRAVEIIERECRWSLDVLPRYGVTRQHMHAMVHWYFEAARTLTNIDSADRRSLEIIEQLYMSGLEYKAAQR